MFTKILDLLTSFFKAISGYFVYSTDEDSARLNQLMKECEDIKNEIKNNRDQINSKIGLCHANYLNDECDRLLLEYQSRQQEIKYLSDKSSKDS